MTKLTSIATVRGIISVGDSIWHCGKRKDNSMAIEELKVTGFKLGYKCADSVVLNKKPELESLGQFSRIVDKKEIKASQISDCYSRCWFHYDKYDSKKRLKVFLEKKAEKLEKEISAVVDQIMEVNKL